MGSTAITAGYRGFYWGSSGLLGFQLGFPLVLNRVFNIGSQQGLSHLQFGAFCYWLVQGDVPGPISAASLAHYWLFLYLRV